MMQESQALAELDEPTMSVSEFATAMRVHRVTVRRWANLGLISYERLPSGRIRIPVSEVRESVTVHPAVRVTPQPDPTRSPLHTAAA